MKKQIGKYTYSTLFGWRKTIVHPEHVVRHEIITDSVTGLRAPKISDNQQPSGELRMHRNLQGILNGPEWVGGGKSQDGHLRWSRRSLGRGSYN